MEKRDRIAGGFYGLLIGDALGVTGGLAGILYGLPGIQKAWLSMLREKEKAAELLEQLFIIHNGIIVL